MIQLALVGIGGGQGDRNNVIINGTIQICTNGEAAPCQQSDLGTFFLVHGVPAPPFGASDNFTVTEYTEFTSMGAFRRIFIPFTNGCTITITNKSTVASGKLFPGLLLPGCAAASAHRLAEEDFPYGDRSIHQPRAIRSSQSDQHHRAGPDRGSSSLRLQPDHRLAHLAGRGRQLDHRWFIDRRRGGHRGLLRRPVLLVAEFLFLR